MVIVTSKKKSNTPRARPRGTQAAASYGRFPAPAAPIQTALGAKPRPTPDQVNAASLPGAFLRPIACPRGTTAAGPGQAPSEPREKTDGKGASGDRSTRELPRGRLPRAGRGGCCHRLSAGEGKESAAAGGASCSPARLLPGKAARAVRGRGDTRPPKAPSRGEAPPAGRKAQGGG